MSTIHLYDHTLLRCVTGLNSAADTYKVMLLSSSAAFDATDTTLAEVSGAGAYEVSGNGWAAGGPALTGVSWAVSSTNGAMFDATDVTVTPAGGGLGQFSAYVIYNDSDTGKPPLAFVEMDAPVTVAAGQAFGIRWPESGIVNLAAV